MRNIHLYLLLSMLIVLLPQIALASTSNANLNYWTTNVSLDADRDAVYEVTFEYNETITEHEYFVRSNIRNVQVYADGKRIACNILNKNIGTTIECNEFEARTIKYNFIAQNVITNLDNWKHFDYRFSVSRITDNFWVTVKLPVGFTIVPRDKLEGSGLYPIEPDSAIKSSDGRRIFISWEMKDPQLGDRLDSSVIYERTGFDIEQILLIVFVLFLIIIMVAITITFRKKNVNDILTVLHENERKIVQILVQEKKDVDQRHIVKQTGLSKSMISRLVKDLEMRGIIKIVKRGRTNKLSLVDRTKAHAFEKKQEKNESETEKQQSKQPEKLPYKPEKQHETDESE